MNVVIHCEVRLSKKLEKVIESGEPIELYISPTKDGVGSGFFKIVAKDNVTLEQINAVGETNLILRNPQSEELAPNLSQDPPLQSIFSDRQPDAVAPAKHFEGSTAIEKLAIVNPDQSEVLTHPLPPQPNQAPSEHELEVLRKHLPQFAHLFNQPAPQQSPAGRPTVASVKGAAMSYAQKAYGQTQEVAQPIAASPKPSMLQPIMSYEELIHELETLPGIDQMVPPPNFEGLPGSMTERHAMVAYEQMLNQLPRLRRPCYLKNSRAGHIEIADMGYIILLNQVLNLSNLPARRILDSRQMQGLITDGYLTFVTHQDFVESLEKPDVEAKSYEKVGSLDEISGETEEEGMMVNHHNRRSSRMPQYRGLRKAEQSDRVEGDAPLMDADFAELVAGMPTARGAGQPARSLNVRAKQPHVSTKAKAVTRVDDGIVTDGYVEDEPLNSLYLP